MVDEEKSDETVKKAPQRKPLFLMIPATWRRVVGESVVVDVEYSEGAEPDTFHVVKCLTKADVHKAIEARKIDATQAHVLAHTKLLRATEVDVVFSAQVMIRY